eukprot:gene28824-38113_t
MLLWPISLIFQSLIPFFVTDMDKTLLYYTFFNESSEIESENIILPASAGSGKVGFVTREVLNKLELIANSSTIICASGMRLQTMLQRQNYFDSIKYWICENGGRIFHRSDMGEMLEVMEWKNRVLSESALETLRSFSQTLQRDNWHVDTDYETMIRLTKRDDQDFMEVIKSIPSSLQYSYNLGHLDIHLPHCDKLSASQWLMTFIESRSGYTTESEGLHPFYFMGDDDNDISAAAASTAAFISQPCSTSMQEYLNSQRERVRLARPAGSDSGFSRDDPSCSNAIFISNQLGHKGAEELLDERLAAKLGRITRDVGLGQADLFFTYNLP